MEGGANQADQMMNGKVQEGVEEHVKKNKKSRKRHKKIYGDIIKQMEFYFSDANISKSRFMKDRLLSGPWIDLDLFMKFNKLNAMLRASFGDETEGRRQLARALEVMPSSLIRLSEDKCSVGRKEPFKEKTNSDDCTIYVENLAKDDTMASLQTRFRQFGAVAYVSFPRYKHSGASKGFAFVEFDDEAGARKALEGYGVAGDVIQPADKRPDQLQSIKAFQTEEALAAGLEASSSSSSAADAPKDGDAGEPKTERADDSDEDEDEDEEPPTKRLKISEGEKDTSEEKNDDEKKEDEKENEETTADAEPCGECVKSKNKKRKRTKRDKTLQEVQKLHAMAWQIMAKKDWKKLRNAYLNLQRRGMAESKERLQQLRSRSREEHRCSAPEREAAASAAAAATGGEAAASAAAAAEDRGSFDFGLIVRFRLSAGGGGGGVDDARAVKQRVRAAFVEPVAYVDVKVGACEYHVRCTSAEQAEKLAAVAALGDEATVLQGEEERAYWQTIQKDRADKFSGAVKPKRERGRNKIVRKLEAATGGGGGGGKNSHKYFGDD